MVASALFQKSPFSKFISAQTLKKQFLLLLEIPPKVKFLNEISAENERKRFPPKCPFDPLWLPLADSHAPSLLKTC